MSFLWSQSECIYMKIYNKYIFSIIKIIFWFWKAATFDFHRVPLKIIHWSISQNIDDPLMWKFPALTCSTINYKENKKVLIFHVLVELRTQTSSRDTWAHSNYLFIIEPFRSLFFLQFKMRSSYDGPVSQINCTCARRSRALGCIFLLLWFVSIGVSWNGA